MKKVLITIQFELDDDFYVGERKTPKEKIRQYEDDFSDIEVLENHLPKWGYDVKAVFLKN